MARKSEFEWFVGMCECAVFGCGVVDCGGLLIHVFIVDSAACRVEVRVLVPRIILVQYLLEQKCLATTIPI